MHTRPIPSGTQWTNNTMMSLTSWRPVTHMYISLNWLIVGSGYDFSPILCQAIIYIWGDFSWVAPKGTNFSKNNVFVCNSETLCTGWKQYSWCNSFSYGKASTHGVASLSFLGLAKLLLQTRRLQAISPWYSKISAKQAYWYQILIRHVFRFSWEYMVKEDICGHNNELV